MFCPYTGHKVTVATVRNVMIRALQRKVMSDARLWSICTRAAMHDNKPLRLYLSGVVDGVSWSRDYEHTARLEAWRQNAPGVLALLAGEAKRKSLLKQGSGPNKWRRAVPFWMRG